MIILLFLILLVLIGIWYSVSKGNSIILSVILHPISFVTGFFEGRQSVIQQRKKIKQLMTLSAEEKGLLSETCKISIENIYEVRSQIEKYKAYSSGKYPKEGLFDAQTLISMHYIKPDKMSELRKKLMP